MKLNSTKFNSAWQSKTLSELGRFARGKSRHRPRNDPALFVNGKYPLVQTGDITSAAFKINRHSATYNEKGLAQSQLWPEGTLCITIAANIAETALLGYPMCFPDSVVGFTAYVDETTEVFMHYVFTYIRSAIQKTVTGSIQDNINIEYLTNLVLKIPSFAEQQKIAAVLSALDAKIDLNQRINAELEVLAKTVYDYWFVQFDFPDAHGRPYKSSGGVMVWNDALKREIPAGWEVGSLYAIANITMGSSPPGDSYNDTGEGVVFFQGSTDFGLRSPDVRQFTTDPVRMARAGDILLSVRAPVGAMNIADRDCCIGRGLAALNSKGGFDGYLYNVMSYFKQVFDRRNVEGTTFGSINKDDLHGLQVVLPPKDVLRAYDEQAKNWNRVAEINDNQNRELSALRDWLLPLLMNGQVKVG
jgi:type I restriction enzyme S subunit